MIKLKHLLLASLIIPMCSFTKASSQKMFALDYHVDFGYGKDPFNYKYGQKFLMATPNVDYISDIEPGITSWSVVTPVGVNSKYVTINSKADFKYLSGFNTSSSNKYWNLTKEYFALFPIDKDYKGTTFTRVSDVTNDFFGDYAEESQRCDEALQLMATNNKSLYTVKEIIPQDVYKPVLEGSTSIYLTSVDNPASIAEIKSILKATDDVDGDITNKIIVSDDKYSGNEHKVGIYPITFSVSDTAGNTTSIIIKVSVVDASKPNINVSDTLISNLSKPLTLDDIKAQISINDNVDKDLTFTFENDTYSGNEQKIGNYSITIVTSDKAGNRNSKAITIKVVDDIKPSISGTESYESSIHTKISIDTMKNGLVITENVDNLTSKDIEVVEDTYSANYNRIGTYFVTFKVSDKSHNESDLFKVNIEVKDTKKPEFFAKDVLINNTVYESLNHDQIIDLLLKSNTIDETRISDKEKQIVVTYDGYHGTSKKGKYQMKFKVTYDDGETKDLSLFINNLKPTNKIVNIPWYTNAFRNITFAYMKVNEFLDNIIDAIVSFFKKIF